MKNLQKLITVGGFFLGSYTTFHGHRLNKDCQLCQYRGLGWILSLSVILLNDYWEKQEQEQNKPQPVVYPEYPLRDYSRSDTLWENTSDSGSDDSNDTLKATNK